MSKKLISLLLAVCMLFCLSACETTGTSSNPTPNDNSSPETSIIDLGICSHEITNITANARNPWDISIINDELYVANGDFDYNSGETSIFKYSNKTLQWINSGTFAQEAIIRFLNLNGENIAIGADPIGRPEYAENYVLKEGKWQTFSKIKDALHTFDAAYYKNAFYFGVGYETNDYPVVKFVPETNEYTNIPLYKKGTNVIDALKNTPNVKYKRVTDLFNINDKLYCALTITYYDGKTTLEFFQLKNNVFEFCQAFKASGMKMNKPIKNQLLFNADAVINNSCYLSMGNLYKTDDFINFKKINIPNNACVTDLMVDKGNGETLYVLAVIKNNNDFNNTIYALNGENLTEVYSFNHSCSALSFEKNGNDFYVGLGGDGISSNDIGKVLKIELN